LKGVIFYQEYLAMKINGKDYQTVWMEENTIKTIEQNKLPNSFEIVSITGIENVISAIQTMVVRGAPAIGAMGAFGLAQAIRLCNEPTHKKIIKFKERLIKARPTAYDLEHGLQTVMLEALKGTSFNETKMFAAKAAQNYANNSAKACKQIGIFGNTLIKNGYKILTHCNAGALATVDFGTALSPFRMAHNDEKNIFIYVDETRPRLQGAKLTAFELYQEGIEHAIIADNAAGYFMANGMVDLMIVGTDRVAANGDIANKIGTYEKAVVAHENKIPVYIAAPISTIDFTCPNGNSIPIEERDENEVLYVNDKRVASEGSPALNPAFDITPAKYITGVITEKGIFKPNELYKLKPENE